MDSVAWIAIFFALGLILFAAELFLPTHGLLGILGAAAVVAGVIGCFYVNQYAGLAAVLATAILAPLGTGLMVRMWPKTPVGRRMTLQPVESRLQPPLIRLGAEGVALSELRPMGVCQFGDERVEVRSDLGMIAPGTRVRVVNIDAGRLIVRKAKGASS